MLNFLKKLFAEEKPQAAKLHPEKMEQWLKEQAASLNFNSFIQEYFGQITEIKLQLSEKAGALKEAQISKEHRNVQERIKNIVIGHRNHYAAEIERFAQNLAVLKKEKFSAINDYEEALLFNEKLNRELDLLARRTAKSYQAAQHLFFKPVEELFKLLGELNRQVKEFNGYAAENKIAELKNIESLVISLKSELEKKEKVEEELKHKKEDLFTEQNKKEKSEEKHKKLIESSDYQQYLKLKEKLSRLEQQFKDVEYGLFSFFSKLEKALKKYEKTSLDNADNKLVKDYLENSTEAFWKDSELKIIQTLSRVKKNLLQGSLQFDDRQKKKFLELIELSESNYLHKLAREGKAIAEEKEKISKTIHEDKIAVEIEKTKKEITEAESKTEKIKKDISETENYLEKINLEKHKEQLTEKIKEVLNVEVKIEC